MQSVARGAAKTHGAERAGATHAKPGAGARAARVAPHADNMGCDIRPRLLRVAVDYLETYGSGTPDAGLLEACSKQADAGVLTWQGETFSVSHGRGHWRWRLTHSSGIWLMLNAKACYLGLTGQVLTTHGADAAYALALRLANSCGSFYFSDYASRLDVAADYSNLNPRPSRLRWDCGKAPLKPDYLRLDLDADTFGTVKVGNSDKKGAAMLVRLYNKTQQLVDVEVTRDYLDHLRGDWLLNGWDESATVWRFEAEMRRPRLKENGVTIADALADPVKVLRLALETYKPIGDAGCMAAVKLLGSPLKAVVPAPRSAHAVPDSVGDVRKLIGIAAREAARLDRPADLIENLVTVVQAALCEVESGGVDYLGLVNKERRRFARIPLAAGGEPF